MRLRGINVTYRQVVCLCFLMSLSKVKSQENGHLPYCLTETVNVEEWGVIQWPPFLLTLSDWNSCTQAIYNLLKMSPWAQSPYLSRNTLRVCASVCWWERERVSEGETRSLRKIRYESQFKQASFRVASCLNSFTWVWHPQGLIPLTTLPRSALMMPGDVRDVAPVSTDVNVVCVVLKTCDDVTLGLTSSTCHLSTLAWTVPNKLFKIT